MNTRFKTILISAIAAIATFISITYISCTEDKCKTIVCAYGGVCNGGSCICPPGYEGTTCATVSRDKFTGNWTVFEKGTITGAAQYPISINIDSVIYKCQITNFYNFFKQPIEAIISHDTITIPTQELEGKIVTGVGYINSSSYYGYYGSITVAYEVVDSITNQVDDFGYISGDDSSPSIWNK
jgi:hypothetical protein